MRRQIAMARERLKIRGFWGFVRFAEHLDLDGMRPVDS